METQITLVVGGAEFALRLRGCPVDEDIRRVYQPFCAREGVSGRQAEVFDLRVDFLDSESSAWAYARGMLPEQSRVETAAQRYSLAAEAFFITFDHADRSGVITIAHTAWPLQVFNSALLNVLQHVLLRRGDIVLHASAVGRNGRAYVFCGPSEAGKSTVASCSSADSCILSQELAGIRHNGTSWCAYGLPYSDDAVFKQRSNRPFPLAGLYLLAKDSRNYCAALSPGHALAGFFTVPHGAAQSVSCEEMLGRFERAVSEVDCFRLHFMPDNTFWRSIEDNEKVSAAV